MLLYKPIPGQEQDNAQFLVHSGVAIKGVFVEFIANEQPASHWLFLYNDKVGAEMTSFIHTVLMNLTQLGYAGITLGQTWQQINQVAEPFVKPLTLASILIAIIYLFYQRKKVKTS